MIGPAAKTGVPLTMFNPGVPDGLQQIVNWMMAKEPTGRYPTPERAAQALQVFLAAGNDALAVPETDPKMRSYLTWLEVEDRKPGVAVGQPGADAPPHEETITKPAESPNLAAEGKALPAEALPVGSVYPTTQAGKAVSRSQAAQERRLLKKMERKGTAPSPQAPAKVQAGPAPAIDVEIMAVPPAVPAELAPFSLKHLTRR